MSDLTHPSPWQRSVDWALRCPKSFLWLAALLRWRLYQSLVSVPEAMAGALPVAFLMREIALPVPEMIILRKVLRQRRIATFMAVVASGILVVGFVFNAVQ